MAGTGLLLKHGDASVDMLAQVKKKGYGLFERQDDWSNCVWFYLDQRTNALPEPTPVSERMESLV